MDSHEEPITSADAISVRPAGSVILGLTALGSTPVVGAAWPVLTKSNDNLALHRALAAAPAGSVLVAQVQDGEPAGLWGELMTLAAKKRGLGGVVIAGTIRDLAVLEHAGFPVFYQGTCPRQATKVDATAVSQVTIQGHRVRRGDLVIADDDGVVILAETSLPELAAAVGELRATERSVREQIEAGDRLVDILGIS